jgi:hypothetical protein
MALLSDASAPSLTLTARFRRSPRLAALGALLFIATLGIFYGNEVRAVDAHRAFDTGAASVLHVVPERLDGENEGRVVHVSGLVSTDETLRDEVFGVSARALRLERHVEMYVWDETKRSENGRVEVDYTKRWSAKVVDSAAFKDAEGHRNPSLFPYEERSIAALAAHLGAFSLPNEGLRQLNGFEPWVPTTEMLASAPAEIRSKARVYAGAVFLGLNPDTPQVGDVRITFQIVKPTVASVVAAQKAQALAPATLSSDRELFLVQAGETDEKSMLGKTRAEASPWFTYVRISCAVALAFGLWLLLYVFSLTRDLGRLQRVRVSFQRLWVCGFLALALGSASASLAWFAYQIWVGAAIAGGSLVSWGIAMLFLRTRKR